MALRDHQVRLSLLSEGEQVLHNCTSHWLIHMRLPVVFLLTIVIPFVAVYFLVSGGVVDPAGTGVLLWFLFSCYGLIMTSYFVVRCINFELGGCVITNQRVLRFGYKGISQMIEREIRPNKIEDVKIVKKGLMSFLFDAADVLIHTSNGEVERLKKVMQSRKIQKIFSTMLDQFGKKSAVTTTDENQSTGETEWIDDALGQTHGEAFDADAHREETIGQIGEVFRKTDDDST